MSELRDFIYLDTSRLRILIAQIQGGIISEINETIKQTGGLSAGLNIGIAPFTGKIDASKGNESERQQTLQLTDPAYFNVLYQYLNQQAKIMDITASSLQTRENLEVGQFIEMRGVAEQPIVESWLNTIRNYFGYFERNAGILSKLQTQTTGQQKGRVVPQFSIQQIKAAKETLDLLIDTIEVARQDPRKTFVRMINEKQAYAVCCGLLPDFILLPLQSILPTQVRVFGRVDRILNENETWKIVNFLQVNQAVPTNQLLTMINSFNATFGQKQIREEDLQLQYPDIFITPIAIYR